MMDMPLITVFTPTYNRKDIITKCYDSLCNQTSKNFVWLVVDDGSTDNTEEVIFRLKEEQKEFDIRYVKKPNGGLHTAYNSGIEAADTELFVCIDSDDWMPLDGIERIEKIWAEQKVKGYTGIIGIDRYPNGECIGDLFPDDCSEMYMYERLTKYNNKGDKKPIHRTELLKRVAPMPDLGEKHFNPAYMMFQVDQFGKLYVTNECFCIVDYQPDGMSSNMCKQYWDSPLSYAETRKLYLTFPNTSISFKIRHSIHFASHLLIAKCFRNRVKESPYPFLAWLCLAPGALLSAYVLYKTREFRK